METPHTSKQILGLEMATDPRWADLAGISLEEILTDHAYCEQKAATYCISLIQMYPDKTALVDALAPIVTEEWGHFRLVLEEIKKRGLRLGFQRKDEYIHKLKAFERKGGKPTDRLVEKLLICALIEARSCERFRLLSLGLKDDELSRFYYRFMISEAGHYRCFLDLAVLYGSDEQSVLKRWKEYLSYEAEFLKSFAPRGDRMH